MFRDACNQDLRLDPKKDDPSTADGSTPYYLIGPDEVAVPTHFYKILASPPHGNVGWQMLAFVMENRGYPSPFQLEKQIVCPCHGLKSARD